LFPDFGSVPWLSVSLWSRARGELKGIRKLPHLLKLEPPGCDSGQAIERIEQGAPLKWPILWSWIHHPIAPLAPDWSHYKIRNAGQWVETLLDANTFWRDINSWSLGCAVREFERLHEPAEIIWQPKHAKHLCRRFHAYQHARYRWHEYMLERHCERCTDQSRGYRLETAEEAQAALIGWLSRQRGFAKHKKVRAFHRAMEGKRRALSLHEEKSFHAERQRPSKRSWRANGDKIGWLILAWPIWDYYRWRFTEIEYAVRMKFRVRDAKGRPLNFQGVQRQQLLERVRPSLDAMPVASLSAFYDEYFGETEEERDWRLSQRKASGGDDATEWLCRNIGLPLVARPKGRPSKKSDDAKPVLYDFAMGVST